MTRKEWLEAAQQRAVEVLKPGDRVRVTACPGTKRTITFARWDGFWMVSASGCAEYSPTGVDRVNGQPVDFTAGVPRP